MHLTVRILGLELLHIELATETDDPDHKARDLSGGSLGSEALDVGHTHHFMGFTNGRDES